ncbi:hypothetical protein L5515_017179 [Caenorhabditis briggsae]|uniref:Uncharacterized protein n=1 Tax=Caenorhabditis briggsae TaxID=6238 RepID=A0AAE8ZPM8_CAEBR|nr:hypothetical protein L3Y34_011317 [Caenorhabditis briggsae]UMM40625.1 hypothetical protein L5515_017179 [Caenorhabditis briggsae]
MSSQKTPTGSELNEVEQKKEKNLLSSGTPTPKAGENGFELNESGTRFSFSKEASTQNPFPDGLPHADINGAIRSFDLEENDAIELKDAPKTASWRAKDGD